MNHSKFCDRPPQVVPHKLYPLPVARTLLGKEGESINRSSFYRWVRLGVITPTRDHRDQLCLYGHEIQAFWRTMTESILFGSYPPWRNRDKKKLAPVPNGPVNLSMIQ